jgi:hypothetical protein
MDQMPVPFPLLGSPARALQGISRMNVQQTPSGVSRQKWGYGNEE